MFLLKHILAFKLDWILILGSKFFLIKIKKILAHCLFSFSIAVENSDINLILVLLEVIYSIWKLLGVTKFHSKGRLSYFIIMSSVMCISLPYLTPYGPFLFEILHLHLFPPLCLFLSYLSLYGFL